MTYRVLILGASYGSLLGTKLLIAGHDVTLVCRAATAQKFNEGGSEVRIKLRDEDEHRAFRSDDLPGNLDAAAPADVDLSRYDLVALAMSEPQYGTEEIRELLGRIAASGLPCLSIMNMPPLPYLRRIPGLDAEALRPAFNCPEVWSGFDPDVVTLCSPDPQAFRLPDEGANVLHVGLPTNFKSAPFASDAHNTILQTLARDIEAIRVDGKDVPVKLRVHDSLFVPFAKWSMLLTGNYRCVLAEGVRPIKDAVHGDAEKSRAIYARVCDVVTKLGASPEDLVDYEKYANAANGLLKPSSAARAVDAGSSEIERVDLLVSLIADQLGMSTPELRSVSDTVSRRLAANQRAVA